MTCHNCQTRCGKHGRDRHGVQRFRCKQCKRTFQEEHERPLDDMRVDLQKATMCIKLLVEGNSIRSTERITGVHRDTIMRLLNLAGKKAQKLMDEKMRGVPCQLVQADEIWTYVNKKQKRLKANDPFEYGDQYVFVAIDAATKLVPSFTIGKRDGDTALHFMLDLAERVSGRIQLSTDAFVPYLEATETAFGSKVDYAQVVKLYGDDNQPVREGYRPARIIGLKSTRVQGDPDIELVSTAYIERQNLTMRMAMRRFTRLTNAFSKKLANLKAAVALHFAYYNFCRIHQSLKCTPAMEAGIADHVWTVEELLEAAA